MSFSKRSVSLSKSLRASAIPSSSAASTPGVRPSPVTGQPTVSTGCPSLDNLLAANSGLALGQLLLVEETGTTDYGSAFLRCYAAEGVLQNQQVHVVGVPEAWGKDLPGVSEDRISARPDKDESAKSSAETERMKIAWRYERMGAHGERSPSASPPNAPASRDPTDKFSSDADANVFCHTFDFTKRLVPPSASHKIHYIPLSRRLNHSPFEAVILTIQDFISRSASDVTVHRVIIPALLSPDLYPPHSSQPQYLLRFLHALRALLRRHSSTLSVMLSLPLSLYPRSSGLTRWIEHMVDGVVELAPFPHSFDASPAAGPGSKEEKPQGKVNVHSLPVFSERGCGGGASIGSAGDDLCFVVSRRKFLIKPFNLPPVEGDAEAQKGVESLTKAEMEF